MIAKGLRGALDGVRVADDGPQVPDPETPARRHGGALPEDRPLGDLGLAAPVLTNTNVYFHVDPRSLQSELPRREYSSHVKSDSLQRNSHVNSSPLQCKLSCELSLSTTRTRMKRS